MAGHNNSHFPPLFIRVTIVANTFPALAMDPALVKYNSMSNSLETWNTPSLRPRSND